MKKKLSDSAFGRIKVLAGDLAQNLQIKFSLGMDEKSLMEVERVKKLLYPQGLYLSSSTKTFSEMASLCLMAQVLHEDEIREKKAIIESCLDAEGRILSECQATIVAGKEEI